VEKRVAARVAKIEQDEREKARGSVSLEIKDLKNQLVEVLKQRDAAQKGELEARKRARELDQRAKNLDLEAARKIDAERQKIQTEASKRAEERYQLRLAEKEKLFTGSPAEGVYRAMLAHHEKATARRRAHELRNDPNEIKRHKQQREDEKRVRLAERAQRKSKIDKEWRARTNNKKPIE
jgi:hypothetical protein